MKHLGFRERHTGMSYGQIVAAIVLIGSITGTGILLAVAVNAGQVLW